MTANPNTGKTVLLTRPALTSQLIAEGYTPQVIPSPWDPSKRAWIFEIDSHLALVVDLYYKQIGKPAPAAIRQWAENQGVPNGN